MNTTDINKFLSHSFPTYNPSPTINKPSSADEMPKNMIGQTFTFIKNGDINTLPNEILTHIFSYIDPSPLFLVNKHWNRIAADQLKHYPETQKTTEYLKLHGHPNGALFLTLKEGEYTPLEMFKTALSEKNFFCLLMSFREIYSDPWRDEKGEIAEVKNCLRLRIASLFKDFKLDLDKNLKVLKNEIESCKSLDFLDVFFDFFINGLIMRAYAVDDEITALKISSISQFSNYIGAPRNDMESAIKYLNSIPFDAKNPKSCADEVIYSKILKLIDKSNLHCVLELFPQRLDCIFFKLIDDPSLREIANTIAQLATEKFPTKGKEYLEMIESVSQVEYEKMTSNCRVNYEETQNKKEELDEDDWEFFLESDPSELESDDESEACDDSDFESEAIKTDEED